MSKPRFWYKAGSGAIPTRRLARPALSHPPFMQRSRRLSTVLPLSTADRMAERRVAATIGQLLHKPMPMRLSLP
jgi:hypothetical protein